MTLEGKWNLVIKTPFGAQKVVASIKELGDGYEGTLENEKGPVPVQNVKLSGDEAWFEGKVKTPMGELGLAFHGVLTDDSKIFGKCKTMFGVSDFSGVREPLPNRV